MADTKTVKSVVDFVILIRETDIAEAANWINGVTTSLPRELMQNFLKQIITEERLQWLVDALALQITKNMRHSPMTSKETQRKGEKFLYEVLEKAGEDCGLDTTEIRPMPIFGQG